MLARPALSVVLVLAIQAAVPPPSEGQTGACVRSTATGLGQVTFCDEILTESECGSESGTYHGDGTQCAAAFTEADGACWYSLAEHCALLKADNGLETSGLICESEAATEPEWFPGGLTCPSACVEEIFPASGPITICWPRTAEDCHFGTYYPEYECESLPFGEWDGACLSRGECLLIRGRDDPAYAVGACEALPPSTWFDGATTCRQDEPEPVPVLPGTGGVALLLLVLGGGLVALRLPTYG